MMVVRGSFWLSAWGSLLVLLFFVYFSVFFVFVFATPNGLVLLLEGSGDLWDAGY